MKLFISTFTVALLAFSIISVAGEPETSKTTIRTLNCKGAVDINGEKVAIAAKIVDTKYTEKFDDGESFDEYWSTLTITDAEQPSNAFQGELTSTDSSEDIAQARETKNGPAYYNLFVDEKAKDDAAYGKLSRSGLLIVACDVNPENGECRTVKGKTRKHAIAFLYNGAEEGSVVGEGSRQYPGEMTCTIQ